jgi:hypothetical protein
MVAAVGEAEAQMLLLLLKLKLMWRMKLNEPDCQ